MPLYDARKTVDYGAESTVLGSSLSILLIVLGTILAARGEVQAG
jgi:hypothetical protein